MRWMIVGVGLVGLEGTQSAAEPPTVAEMPSVRLERVLPDLKLTRPTQLVARADRSDRLYVLEQAGRILEIDPSAENAESAEVFMDLRDRVNFGGNEEGLLSMTFHPKVAVDRRFFLYYTADEPRRAVLSEFTLDEGGVKGVPTSERVLLEVPQPWSNHNGGTVVFGPDGMLYLSVGDGGAANDPQGHGQDLGTLLGSIIRIDVDRRDGERGYSIPGDNPFVAREGARAEIWAYGLRNVWRMSFDRETGELWAGDVGQNKFEEIDLIVKGGNYGWNRREGFHPFGREASEPPQDPFIDPVIEYPRDEGVSVTGGHVYRGADETLRGVYLYADYAMGTIWGIRRRPDGSVIGPEVLTRRPRSLISSFGEANDGTLYVTTFEGGERPGRGAIWRIEVIDGIGDSGESRQ